MSQPRTTEQKLRQRRKRKLALLRQRYRDAKSQDAKEKILAKAVLVSPYHTKAEYQSLWEAA